MKEIKPVQDSFEILDVADGEPAAETRTEPALPTFAEPISPETVSRFPHLESQVGQIVLGNGYIQIVLAGIPPVPSTNPWQPAILEAFVKRGDKWQRFSALGPIDLKISQGANGFYAIGLDTDTTEQKASVSFFYATRESQGPRIKVTYHLSAHEGAMHLLFDDFLSSKNKAGRGMDWQLRFHPNAGETFVIDDRFQKKHRYARALGHYLGDEILSLVGFGPLQVRNTDDEVIVASPRGTAYKPGLEFLIGEKEAGQLPFKIVTTENCYQNLLKKPEVNHSSMMDCRIKAAPGYLKLALFPDDSVIEPYPRLIFLNDQDDRKVGVIPAMSGEDYPIFISQNDIYKVVEVTSKGETRRAEFSLADKKVAKLTLAPRKPGSLNISLSKKTARLNVPAIMSIVNAHDPRAIPIGRFIPESKSIEPLSPYSVLVKKWPVQIPLPSGQYNVTIQRGLLGTFCQLKVALAPSQRQDLDCQVENQGNQKTVLRSGITGDLATHIQDTSPVMLADVLGVRALSSDPYASTKPGDVLSLIPALEVIEGQNGVSLRLMPASPEMAQEWRKFQENGKGSKLQQLATFRTKYPDTLLEMNCPPPGTHVEDYFQQVLRLAPDAIQVFGCGSPNHQERLLKQMAKILPKRPKGILITSASFLKSHWQTLHFPQFAMPAEKLPILSNRPFTVEEVSKMIKDGEYSLVAGGYVAVSPHSKEALVEKKGKVWPFQVKVETLAKVKPTRIVVYNEYDVWHQEKLNQESFLEPQTLKILLKPKHGVKWVRVELRGKDETLAQSGQEIVLATTNFLPL